MNKMGISEKGLERFFDDRFGMFIHWGLYSIIGRSGRNSLAEWVMHGENIPVPEYEKLVPQFNPVKFDADEWVKIADDAGMRYMVLTSRHHDGFSMYDTALTDYKITNTPFKRDPAAELAEACARNGNVRLGFYSSLMDWHHPAYRLREESGLAWEDYLDFLHGQVRELCTNYGEIACIWFDGDWPHHPFDETNQYFKPGGSFEYEKLYGMIHELQPDAYVHNNRHEEPLPGEDVQGFEQDLPGENSTGFNTTTVYDMPVEVCMTINDNWGFHAADDNHKSTRRLLNNLIRSASINANYLLNVGPTAEGEIIPVHRQRLSEMGAWLHSHGEAIYGARAGVVKMKDGVSTRKGDTHYLIALNHDGDRIYMESLPEGVSEATLLRNGEPLKMGEFRGYPYVTVPAEMRDPNGTVVKLK